MTYSQSNDDQSWRVKPAQPRSQRGLHKSANKDDVWHSVWERIENAAPVSSGASPSAGSLRVEPSLQAPRDYVVELG